MSNNRVLFIAPSAYTLGGVQTWLNYLLPGLDACNYESTIALPNGVGNEAHQYLETHPFNLVRFIETYTGTIQGRVEAIEQLILDVNPLIVVVVNIYDSYQALNNLRQRGLSNAFIVSTIHGIQTDLLTGIRSNSSIIDAVVSTNRLTQKLINEHTGIETIGSLYAPYGVDEATTQKDIHKDSFIVAYVGRIEEQQKRIDDLLAIFSKLLAQVGNLEILIAGSGPDMPAINRWLEQESKYAEQIKYLGVLEPDKVAVEVYSKADVLLLTSLWETGPIVAWEAMRFNVTLISSRYIGCQEEGSLIDQENCLLFDIGDIDGAVAKVQQSTEPELRKQLNSNASLLIDTKYSIDKSIDTWAKCFDQISTQEPKPYANDIICTKDQGRLSYVFRLIFGNRGPRFAERVRRLVRVIYKKNSSNDEWPHSYSNANIELINLDNTLKKQ